MPAFAISGVNVLGAVSCNQSRCLQMHVTRAGMPLVSIGMQDMLGRKAMGICSHLVKA